MSSVGDVLAFGRMLLDNGSAMLAPETVAEMTRDQLIPAQRNAVWPGFSFLDDQDWGYGMPCSTTLAIAGIASLGQRGRASRHRTCRSPY